ncbi:hypothetical protein DEO72_LG6g1218 [Vigna unguiculata]|uniref:Secreted protein n=1 Tax=Vigna unguiculata TaxID=3917 RepID=A0A4D6M9L2_VIGUN|nr:hypothetical protein DEO72_LG6g1218 [Vigna unguiculata]
MAQWCVAVALPLLLQCELADGCCRELNTQKNSAWPWLQGVWRRCSGGEDDSDSMGLSLVMVACSSSFAMVAMASVAVLRLVLAYGYAEKMMVADLVRWLALCTHGSRSPLCDGSVLQEGGEKMEVVDGGRSVVATVTGASPSWWLATIVGHGG